MKKLNTFQKILKKFRYGLVMMVIRSRLTRFNIDISPYHWSLEADPERQPPEIPGHFDDYSFEFFGAKEMEMIGPRVSNQNTPVAEMLERLDQGLVCFGAKYKGEIAAFTWARLYDVDNRFLSVKLKPNEAYLFDTHTMKAFRGKNLAAYLRARTFRAFGEKMGKDTFYSLHISFNKSSTRFKQKLNVKTLRTGLYIGLFNKYHWNITLRDNEKK
ncbi:MAG: GNAT family N-acetyltransferase [Candidatus Omnitrophica bacterium]|nr:GNAT family N-acetyltransferase [Candidatus Omnitrophota bacterium]